MDIHILKKFTSGASGRTYRVNDIVTKRGMNAGLVVEICALLYLPLHDNIPKLHSFSFGDDIVVNTQYAGKDLYSWGKRNIDKLALAEIVMPQLVSAITHLYCNHLVHCDIKPSNVVVSEDGKVTLIDFGAIGFSGNKSDHVSGKFCPSINARPISDPLLQMTWCVAALMYTLITGNNVKCKRYFVDTDDCDNDSNTDTDDDVADIDTMSIVAGADAVCMCFECVDWGMYTHPIFGEIRKLAFGEFTWSCADNPVVPIAKPVANKCTYIRAMHDKTSRSVFPRAHYIYQFAPATPNAWRVCACIATCLRKGIAYNIPKSKRAYFDEFADTIRSTLPYMFNKLPADVHHRVTGSAPDYRQVVDNQMLVADISRVPVPCKKGNGAVFTQTPYTVPDFFSPNTNNTH